MHRGFWWENLREEEQMEDLGVDGRIILKWFLEKENGSMDCFIWLRIKTGSKLL